MRFFEGLASQISRLPAEIGVHKVLPVFRDYVRVEGTAQQVGGGVEGSSPPCFSCHGAALPVMW